MLAAVINAYKQGNLLTRPPDVIQIHPQKLSIDYYYYLRQIREIVV